MTRRRSRGASAGERPVRRRSHPRASRRGGSCRDARQYPPFDHHGEQRERDAQMRETHTVRCVVARDGEQDAVHRTVTEHEVRDRRPARVPLADRLQAGVDHRRADEDDPREHDRQRLRTCRRGPCPRRSIASSVMNTTATSVSASENTASRDSHDVRKRENARQALRGLARCSVDDARPATVSARPIAPTLGSVSGNSHGRPNTTRRSQRAPARRDLRPDATVKKTTESAGFIQPMRGNSAGLRLARRGHAARSSLREATCGVDQARQRRSGGAGGESAPSFAPTPPAAARAAAGSG